MRKANEILEGLCVMLRVKECDFGRLACLFHPESNDSRWIEAVAFAKEGESFYPRPNVGRVEKLGDQRSHAKTSACFRRMLRPKTPTRRAGDRSKGEGQCFRIGPQTEKPNIKQHAERLNRKTE